MLPILPASKPSHYPSRSPASAYSAFGGQYLSFQASTLSNRSRPSLLLKGANHWHLKYRNPRIRLAEILPPIRKPRPAVVNSGGAYQEVTLTRGKSARPSW